MLGSISSQLSKKEIQCCTQCNDLYKVYHSFCAHSASYFVCLYGRKKVKENSDLSRK